MDRTIIGIDPGSRATGFGVVLSRGSSLKCLGAGVIRVPADIEFSTRLGRLYSGVVQVIEQYSPSDFAIEDMFFARNAQSALKLGHARAAAMLAAVHRSLPVYEYTPLVVKKSVAGYGKAEKQQVQQMVKLLLSLSSTPPQDAADALAVAICHANTAQLTLQTSCKTERAVAGCGTAQGCP